MATQRVVSSHITLKLPLCSGLPGVNVVEVGHQPPERAWQNLVEVFAYYGQHATAPGRFRPRREYILRRVSKF